MSMMLFFGFVGALNAVCLAPVLLILHLVGFVNATGLTLRVFALTVCKGAAILPYPCMRCVDAKINVCALFPNFRETGPVAAAAVSAEQLCSNCMSVCCDLVSLCILFLSFLSKLCILFSCPSSAAAACSTCLERLLLSSQAGLE